MLMPIYLAENRSQTNQQVSQSISEVTFAVPSITIYIQFAVHCFILLELIFFYYNFSRFFLSRIELKVIWIQKWLRFLKTNLIFIGKCYIAKVKNQVLVWACWTNLYVFFFLAYISHVFFSSVINFTEIFYWKLKQNRNYDSSIRYKKFAIRFQTPTINMTFNIIFDCCRFVARFWNHSMQKLKFWCHHLMKAFSMRWCKVHRTLCACASRIGWVTCRRIKLVIHSRDMSRICCKVTKNCVLSKICPG